MLFIRLIYSCFPVAMFPLIAKLHCSHIYTLWNIKTPFPDTFCAVKFQLKHPNRSFSISVRKLCLWKTTKRSGDTWHDISSVLKQIKVVLAFDSRSVNWLSYTNDSLANAGKKRRNESGCGLSYAVCFHNYSTKKFQMHGKIFFR